MPRGASARREREFEELQQRFRQEGRYAGREAEVAARIVNKQRTQYGETRAQRRARREGRAPDRGLPIADYATLTVPQIVGRLAELDPRALQRVAHYEARHKNRKTLRARIERELKRR